MVESLLPWPWRWLPRQGPRKPPLTQRDGSDHNQQDEPVPCCSLSHRRHFCALALSCLPSICVSPTFFVYLFHRVSSWGFFCVCVFKDTITRVDLGLEHQFLLFCLPFGQIQEKTCHKELEDSRSLPFESSGCSWPLILESVFSQEVSGG